MEVFKKLVLFMAATIAAVFLMAWSLDAFGFRSPIFAFLANWLAMSWAAIVGQAVHVLIFVLMLLFAGYALLKGWLDAVVWLLVFNIMINGYPIMLQRYNRIKLQELLLMPPQG